MRRPECRSFVYVLMLLLFVASSVFAEDVKTSPPLPEGAYPEWNLQKAWRTSSDMRERFCINGFWRFRSDFSIKTDTTAFSEGFDGAKLQGWQKQSLKQGTFTTKLDTHTKKGGKSSLEMEFDLPGKMNFFHFRKTINVKPSTSYKLSAEIKSELKQGTINLEVQDARDYKIFTTKGEDIGNFPRWKSYSLEFKTTPTTKRLSILIRYYGRGDALKGKVWMDNLQLIEKSGVDVSRLKVPDGGWGFIKVPGSWKGGVYWNKTDPAYKAHKQGSVRYAWFERELNIPQNWAGRKVLVTFDRIASEATVFCNGQECGSLGYMGGSVDITKGVKAGETARISVLVNAVPPADVLADMGGEAIKRAKPWKQGLSMTGIIGDVYLDSMPNSKVAVGPFQIITSVNKKEISVAADIAGGSAGENLELECVVRDGDKVVKTFSGSVAAGSAKASASSAWQDPVLWEIGKPKFYTMAVALKQDGKVIDQSLPERFGFREFEIRGKFFYLNGIKINLRPCTYWGYYPAWASRECMERWLKNSIAEGHNFVYAATTDFPGKPEWTRTFLNVCDEFGVLSAVTPAEIRLFWKMLDKKEVQDEWQRVARVRVLRDRNHPSLVMWRMNMNLDCYAQDQNPLLFDSSGVFPEGSTSARKNVAMLKSNAYVKSLDPTRPTYNHACGDHGEIYNLNNYLCWPQEQDLREWLYVWAEKGKKPLMMAEFDLPYPGSFCMLDPTRWWMNEPLMTEYGAILLGEKSYRLETPEFVDHVQASWKPKTRTWHQSYGYFCSMFPPILDECSSKFYKTTIPAWRTWGISGGTNSWENTGRRLKKYTGKPGKFKFPELMPNKKLDTDWAALQQPGFFPNEFRYARGGGGEIRCNFDFGTEDEKEYFEPTRRGKIMRELHQPLYSYIAGPGKNWPEQDHAFYVGEKIGKSVIVINDERAAVTFQIEWKAEIPGGKVVASGSGKLTVAPAETGQLEIAFKAPRVNAKTPLEISAVVKAGDNELLTDPFAVQIWPALGRQRFDTSGWALYDPVGRTAKALSALGVRIPALRGESIPNGLKVLVIGCKALAEDKTPEFFSQLPGLIASGLQVVMFEQDGAVYEKLFNLRTITRGTRQVWIRDHGNRIFDGINNADLADWRGKTTLGPLDGEPESRIESQRWKRVWRCSQRGVVASNMVEKPHVGSVLPFVDCEFDLRYTALWQETEGRGRMLFCQLDVTDRVGKDPAVDLLVSNMVNEISAWQAVEPTKAYLVASSSVAVGDILPLSPKVVLNPPTCPVQGKGEVVILSRGCLPWLVRNSKAVGSFLKNGGRVVALSLSKQEATTLSLLSGEEFTVSEKGLLAVNLMPEGPLPASLRGVSPAEIHWRERRTAMVVEKVASGGWKCDTGVVASAPVGAGEVVWLAALPSDFDKSRREDLVFTRVNTSRLIALVLSNLGVGNNLPWSLCLEQKPMETVALPAVWRVRQDPKQTGLTQKWMAVDTDDASAPWRDIAVPGMWEKLIPEWAQYNGDMWYRVRVKIPEIYRGVAMEFYVGAIDDTDEVFFNGEKIGETTTETERWWVAPRHYPISPNLIKYGGQENVIAIRINDHFGEGGLLGPIQIRPPLSDDERYPTRMYIDSRVARDDPYAYMRW